MPSTPLRIIPAHRRTLASVAAALAFPMGLAGCGGTATEPSVGGEPSVARTASESASSADAEFKNLVDAGIGEYSQFVTDEARKLLAGTEAFADAYAAGDEASARDLYAATRMHWERIEPVAESFGELDPKLDAREADLEPGQEWTGWHRAEKDLFPPAGYTPMTPQEREAIADQLVSDTKELNQRTSTVELTADSIGNGAKELLDEVATGKVTGEEEIWSHTDLWDFQANVEGARTAFGSLEPALEQRDAALAADLGGKFDALQAELDKHATGTGFAYYDELNQEQIQQLAARVDALGEPLSRLTAAVMP